MPQDEFEQLLERCNARLSEIALNVPKLEEARPRQMPVYSLTPPAELRAAAEAAPPPAPAPPAASAPAAPPPAETARLPDPEPVRALEPEPAGAPQPVPARTEAEAEEQAVFPPRRFPPRTPPPSRLRPEAAAAPSFSRPAVAAAAGLLAAAGAYGAWVLRRPPAELDLPLDDAQAMAVRPEKGDLLVAEGRELIDLSRGGKTLSRAPLDAPVDSMSWNQGSLWIADGRASSVSERGADGKTTVFSLNHVPAALYAKDRYLWTAEKGARALHQFLISRSILGAMLQPIDSFELSGLSPESFTIDDSGTLWVADGPTRRLYRLRLENGAYKKLDSAPLSPFVGPSGKLRDLTVDGDGVWILAEQDGGRVALRRIAVARLDWSPS